jgi:hypothetical protein
MEHFPDNGDRQVELLGEIIETMQGDFKPEAPASPDQTTPAEHKQTAPPPIDFKSNALEAVRGGVFAIVGGARIENEFGFSGTDLPDSLLDTPYGNGPAAIALQNLDVLPPVMKQVRKNFMKANQLLLPTDQLMRYFHQRFTAADPFDAGGIGQALDKYKPEIPEANYINYNTEDVSFRLDINRARYKRNLFTAEELEATLDFVAEYPALPVAIAAYQGTILDYLDCLGDEFTAMAGQAGSGVTAEDLEKYQTYTQAWNTPNFYKELLPALMLHFRKAQIDNPEAPSDSLITPELFHDALNFLFKNGAFRNFVDIPAHTALDGKERVNKFICPAAGLIHEHIVDGRLLYKLYGLTHAGIVAGDSNVQELIVAAEDASNESYVRLAKAKLLAQRRAAEAASPVLNLNVEGLSLQEAVGKALLYSTYDEKPAVFSHDGTEYSISPDMFAQTVREDDPRQPGDREIIVDFEDTLDGVLGRAAYRALELGAPTQFRFNGVSYRILPESARRLFIGR